jgi:hypothetical protein
LTYNNPAIIRKTIEPSIPQNESMLHRQVESIPINEVKKSNSPASRTNKLEFINETANNYNYSSNEVYNRASHNDLSSAEGNPRLNNVKQSQHTAVDIDDGKSSSDFLKKLK